MQLATLLDPFIPATDSASAGDTPPTAAVGVNPRGRCLSCVHICEWMMYYWTATLHQQQQQQCLGVEICTREVLFFLHSSSEAINGFSRSRPVQRPPPFNMLEKGYEKEKGPQIAAAAADPEIASSYNPPKKTQNKKDVQLKLRGWVSRASFGY